MAKNSKGVCGRGGMGSHKHGISGKTPKSPRIRFMMELDAKQQDKKAKEPTCKYGSIQELFHKRNKV